MKMSLTRSILFISLFISSVYSLSYEMGGKAELCVKSKIYSGKNMKITYMFTGKNEKNVEFKVLSPIGVVIHESQMESLKTFTFVAQMDGDYIICFYNVDKADKRLSFDFSENINNVVLATDDHMKSVETDIAKGIEKADEIGTNIRFQNERDEDHFDIMESTESRIYYSTFFKVGILILVSIIQIYMVTATFKKTLMSAGF